MHGVHRDDPGAQLELCALLDREPVESGSDLIVRSKVRYEVQRSNRRFFDLTVVVVLVSGR